MSILTKFFKFIAKYDISIHIERCGYKDGFIITVYKCGLYRNVFINDCELLSYDEDDLFFIIKGTVHELLEEEQRNLKLFQQFKKMDTTVEIK